MGFAGMYMSENVPHDRARGRAGAARSPTKPKSAFKAGLALGFGSWAKSQAFLLAPLWALLLALARPALEPGIAVGVAW